MHPLHRRIGALCGGVPHHFHRLIITTAPSCVLQVHTRVRQIWSKKRSAKAGGARRSQERGPGWSEPRDTRAAIAAPWVAVEGFGTMDLKVTAFDAVLYEGASRGIPTTKLHSMRGIHECRGCGKTIAGDAQGRNCARGPKNVVDEASLQAPSWRLAQRGDGTPQHARRCCHRRFGKRL